jgi:Predicted multitransmembrane protein
VGGLYFLTGLFFVLLLIIGQKKGLFSLISILTTLGLIFWVLTPLVLNGFNVVLATILVCVLASIIAIYIVGGINAKSAGAILGTVLSLIIAGGLSVLIIKLSSLTGFSSEQYLFLFSAHPNLNFIGILASAMIIGALGAVMDIAMSISSTINELFFSNSEMRVSELFTSGMNVGKDIIGTMANTLILAYLGGSLALVFLSNNIDLQKFFNLNQVATEISAALIGSIAIVLCVPITAIISAYLIKKFSKPALAENDFSDIMMENRK